MTLLHCFEGAPLQRCREALTKERASATEETRVRDSSEIPQRLKPYPSLGVNGTLKPCPFKSPNPTLQILLRPLVHAVERLFDVFDRIGHAEPQVAFAESPERRT